MITPNDPSRDTPNETDRGDDPNATAEAVESEEEGTVDAVPAAATGPAPGIDREHEQVVSRAVLSAAEYRKLTVPQILEQIETMSPEQIRTVKELEESHRRRKTLLVRLERRLRDTCSTDRRAPAHADAE